MALPPNGGGQFVGEAGLAGVTASSRLYAPDNGAARSQLPHARGARVTTPALFAHSRRFLASAKLSGMLKGTLLAESLIVGSPVQVEGLRARLIVRRDVSSSATGEQPKVWTFVEFEADDDLADVLADTLAYSLRAEGGWYADFTTRGDHFVVFAQRVFRYRMGDVTARAEVEAYGRSVGVPDHQLDWNDSEAAD